VKFRRANTPRLSADEARRQGRITNLAFLLLGKERAIAFLNADNERLGARPLDLAIADESGCARIEAELRSQGASAALSPGHAVDGN
jgi:hypothetical protein